MAKRKERTADVYNIEKSKGEKRKVFFNDYNGIDQIELSRDQQEYKGNNSKPPILLFVPVPQEGQERKHSHLFTHS